MNRLLRLFRTGLVALVAAVCINAFAQLPADFLNRPHEADESRDAVRASIVTNRTAATPGSAYEVGILLEHKKGWHTYWKNPGDSGEATHVEWTVPKRWTMTSAGWSIPTVLTTGPLTSYVYQDKVLLPFKLDVPWGTPYGTKATIRAKVSWVACKDVCVPQQAELRLTFPIEVASKPSAASALFAQTKTQTPERVTNTPITAVQDGRRILLELPASAGLVSESLVFIAEDGNLIARTSPVSHKAGSSDASLLLTLKDSFTGTLSSLTGTLIADGGAANRGWAIETTIPVRPGKIGQDAKVVQKKATVQVTTKVAPVAPLTALSALTLAFTGGLILNLMPCVFPVLSLKFLHLIDKTRRRGSLAVNGLAFTAGVLTSTLALAALLLFVRSLGYAVGWGFQLQTPWFVAALVLLFFALTLNLLGVFEFTAASHLADSRAAKALPSSGPWSTFGVGILTVVVASPCTAPFMGAALGFAVTKPAYEACAIFLALGMGIALPWLLLTLFPVWTKWLPKPGVWMVYLRRFMALPMFCAVLWLVWVLSHQVNGYGLITLFLGAGALTLFLWAFGREQYGRGRSIVLKSVSLFVTFACLAVLGLSDTATSRRTTGPLWQPYSPRAVERAVEEGKPVIIDFTASWCITCQFNKITALHTDQTQDALKQYGYRCFVADWTRRDAEITRLLNAFGRTGVPLYVLYDTSGKPVVLPELLQQKPLLEALKKASEPALKPKR